MSEPRVIVGGRDLAELAGDGLPDLSVPETMALAAAAVHRAVLQRAGTNADAARREPPQEMDYSDASGYRWRGSVNYIIDSMWNTLDEPEPAIKAFKRELNWYLRASGNLVCTNQGNRVTPSTWFVRADFNDVPPAVAPKPIPPRPAEKKLTKAEAGEDRSPARVETALAPFVCTWAAPGRPGGICGERRGSQSWLNKHVYDDHCTAESWIATAMEELNEPAFIVQIHAIATKHGYPGSAAYTGRILHEMVEEGEAGGRETPSGQWKFWLPVPPDTAAPVAPGGEPQPSPQLYPCREPDCPRPPMDAGERRRHEDTMHPESPHREWWCPLDEMHWYSKAALARHLDKSHELPASDDLYQEIMDEAFHPAPEPEPEPEDLAVVVPADAMIGATPDQVITWLRANLTGADAGRVAVLEAEVARLKEENTRLSVQLRRVRLAFEGT